MRSFQVMSANRVSDRHIYGIAVPLILYSVSHSYMTAFATLVTAILDDGASSFNSGTGKRSSIASFVRFSHGSILLC